jgi:Ala-tRNA(Pro) deacylase
MTASKKIIQYLKDQNIAFETLSHPEAFTAQEIAQAQHVPGKELAKTVVVKSGDKYALAVVSALQQVDLKLLSDVIGSPTTLAEEKELAELFPGCELGAMPPFGNLYNLPVFVDESLKDDESIVFNAGTHVDTIKIAYSDFEKAVNPTKASIGKKV